MEDQKNGGSNFFWKNGGVEMEDRKNWGEETDDRKNGGWGWRCTAENPMKTHPQVLRKPYVSLKILFIEIMIHRMFLLLCFIEKYSSLKNLSFNTLHWIFWLKNMFDWIFHFLICFIESLFFIIMIDWNFSKLILNSLFEWVYPLWFCSCIFKLEDWVYQCVFCAALWRGPNLRF